MTSESRASIVRSGLQGGRLFLFGTMSLIMTAGAIAILFSRRAALDLMLSIPLYGLLLYMLWDYTRLTFKKVWNDR